MTSLTDASYVPSTSPPAGERWRNLSLLKSDPVVLFVFLSLLLIGADRLGLRAGGMTLRVVFPVLIAAGSFLYLRFGRDITFDKTLTIFFLLWGIAGGLSVLNSYDPVKSVGYTIWILFDFFVIITLCYNYAKHYEPGQTLSLWFLVFRIHAVLIALEICYNLARGMPVRPYLWFYESSYLAIFMTAYFGSALFMLLRQGRKFLLDFCMAGGALLIVASATGFFGILFAILLNFIVARQRIKLLLASLALIGLFGGTLFVFMKGTLYYELIFGFLLSNDGNALDLILLRGGNRIVRVLVGWQAFLQHPWLGIGVGADNAYMEARPFPDQAWNYIRPWTEVDYGQPFCNVFISVLGSMGILGFIPFMGIIVYAGVVATRQIRQGLTPESTAVFIGFFSTLLALQLDGTVQRYYLWTPLGLALGMAAHRKRTVSPLKGKDAQ